MIMKSVAVTIPLYKEIPNSLEMVSLKQCLKVLHNYPVIFFAPESLNTVFYESLFTANNKFKIERFESKYFKDLNSYNKLMLNSTFYKRFRVYKYILIYQLDAYVFKDELQYWCDAGYDYIGAPWFDNWNIAQHDSAFLGVGNGGFSLRKVKSHLKVLRSFSYIRPLQSVIENFFNQKSSLAALKQLFFDLTIQNNTYSLFNNYSDNEDIFWGAFVSGKFSHFKIPSMNIASRFSMEVNAEMLYHLNGDKLPFGCHAWGKYETKFWSKFIVVEQL